MSKENKEASQTPEENSSSVIEEKMEKKTIGDQVFYSHFVDHIPSETEPSKSSTVQDLINRIKNDSQITDAAKLDTLSLLIMKFRKENDE